MVLLNICCGLFLVIVILDKESCLAHQPYRSKHVRTASFETVIKDFALEEHVIEVIHEESSLDCGFACLQTHKCQSYNARQETTNVYECELNNSTKTLDGGNFVAKPGVTYYGTDTFPKLGCGSSTCSNDGKCETKQSYPFYVCPYDFDLVFPSSRRHEVTRSEPTAFEELTMCLWFKTSFAAMPFVNLQTATSAVTMGIFVNSLHFMLTANYEERGKSPVLDLSDDLWHHVCLTWNSTSGFVHLFIDGFLRSYPTQSCYKGQTWTANGTFTLGYYKHTDNTEVFFKGKLSQFNIWSYVLPSSQIKQMAKNCTTTSGNVVDWARDFAPTEQDTAEKRNCSGRVDNQNDYDLQFPNQSVTNYAKINNVPQTKLTQFTLSWWMKTSWRPIAGHFMTVVSVFGASDAAEADQIMIWISESLEICLEMAAFTKSKHKLPPINDNRWHHMLITWDNEFGNWDFYLDGTHRSSIEAFVIGNEIFRGGVITIGQEQDSLGGGFGLHQAFQGTLSRLNLWDKVLPLEIIVSLAKEPGNENGNVVAWRDVREHLYGFQATAPSSVKSNVGTSNYKLDFPQFSNLDYARIDVDGEAFRKISVCAWINLSNYGSNYQPTLISYATKTNHNQLRVGFVTDVYFSVNNTEIHYLGGIARLKGKKWNSLCVTWDGNSGSALSYVEGIRRGSAKSIGQNVVVPGKGVWILANEQDKYGGGLSKSQGIKGGLAQVNVWDYVLPSSAIEGLATGASSVEGNMLRWTDFITNRNPGGSFTMDTFQFYLPNAIVEQKRDGFCNRQYDTFQCPVGPLFARIGKTYPVGSNGNGWRCYCKSSLNYDKNTDKEPSNNIKYFSDSNLKDIF